jgi:hypothetical protein
MENDRVTYHFSMKVGLPNYGSAGFDVGLSSDIRDGETTEQAFKRVKRIVDVQAEGEMNEINNLTEKKD